ncbi:PepSY-associated TM helix domain-containing protein [Deinococcus arenicola]|uniref:PepSY-associated TM helix domain-containing protein n=1 Tax=Deinococcus arenicola TaxID=2994950 RepID=A0ABU4DPS4_9DEIO|nr:PepSY-associated TM helix domain-containing protein [Deinococcus sp. ZS9-10]MDV6373910.1 PepSY-associated TM helix domain-containing protein [Deinococcus sp. ZS9-10]
MLPTAKPEREAGTPRPAARPRTLKARSHVWLRWLHTYTSMISLLVVLFFALTGITLNHPDWAFGHSEVRREVTGTLPAGWITGTAVDWLNVAEELRAQQGLHGRAEEPRVDGTEASISFLGPGYSADTVIDTQTGKYTTNILAQGGVAVLNDLHRGRDTGGAWSWLIDVSGGILTLVAVTGIGILLYLKKTRGQALAVMGVASVIVLLLGWRALG